MGTIDIFLYDYCPVMQNIKHVINFHKINGNAVETFKMLKT